MWQYALGTWESLVFHPEPPMAPRALLLPQVGVGPMFPHHTDGTRSSGGETTCSLSEEEAGHRGMRGGLGITGP